MQCPGNITDLCLPKAGQVFIVQRSRLANEVETVELETVKACPWSSYGIRGGGMACGYWVLTSPLGIVLYCIALYWELTPPLVYQVNPSLTRAQFCLPGPSTDANQSNCDLYIPACKDKGNINVSASEEKTEQTHPEDGDQRMIETAVSAISHAVSSSTSHCVLLDSCFFP